MRDDLYEWTRSRATRMQIRGNFGRLGLREAFRLLVTATPTPTPAPGETFPLRPRIPTNMGYRVTLA